MDISEFLGKSHHFSNLGEQMSSYFDYANIRSLHPSNFYKVDLAKGQALIDRALELLGYYIMGNVSHAQDQIKLMGRFGQQATFQIWMEVVKDRDALRGIGLAIFQTCYVPQPTNMTNNI